MRKYSAHSKNERPLLESFVGVHLLFRSQSIDLPRDAHDQYLRCKQITADDLQPGDLIFLAAKNSSRMNHVMIYAGAGKLLESAMSYGGVCSTLLPERLAAVTIENSLFYGRVAPYAQNPHSSSSI